MQTLDCRAHACPYPVVETRKALLARPGEPLTVLVGDEAARENVSRLARNMGYEVRENRTEGGFSLELTFAGAQKPDEPFPEVRGKTVALFASDTFGSGNDELGRILLKNFIFTLAEAGTVPDALYFVNAGVKLTSAGSEVLEALERIACQGADIASCGLCLDFYHLKDKLAVGRVTNMLEIVNALQSAGRILRP